MPRLVRQISQRQDPAAPPEWETRSAMHRQEVEEDRIAGFHLVPADVKGLTIRLDVGHLNQSSLGEPLGLSIHERARHEPRSLMSTGHELKTTALWNRINRDPCADASAFDVVIGLVLMPWGAL